MKEKSDLFAVRLPEDLQCLEVHRWLSDDVRPLNLSPSKINTKPSERYKLQIKFSTNSIFDKVIAYCHNSN